MKLRTAIVWLSLLATLATVGCVRVRPWEREVLARPDMAWAPDPIESSQLSHIFFSKEAALQPGEAGGGGCGCN